MGVALQTQRATGELSVYEVIEQEEALAIFNAFAWEKEIEAWEQIPEGTSEDFMPLFQLVDDSEHSLRITAYSPDLVGLSYDYPVRGRMTFAGPEFEQGSFGTDLFPRESVRELITLFFSCDDDRMLSLLQRYPSAEASDSLT